MKYIYFFVAAYLLMGVGFFVYAQNFKNAAPSVDAVDILRGSTFEYFQHPNTGAPQKYLKVGGLPATLRISKLQVDAHIEYVGVTPEGAMDVPSNPSNVAWLQSSARPGEMGTAVIDGHYGIKDGKASAFDALHTLRIGDRVSVETVGGAIILFSVREIRRYDANANAPDVFISADGKAHLNLITCEGVWNNDTNEYPKRLVIFTDRVE